MLEEYQQQLQITDQSWYQKWQRVVRGLKAPKDSGEYKYATMAIQRIFGPSSASTAVCVTVLLLLLLMRFSVEAPPPELDVLIQEPELEEPLDIIEEPPTAEPEQTELVSLTPPSEFVDTDVNAISGPAESFGDDSTDKLVPVAAVDYVKSPMILSGLLGGHGAGRTSAGRESALGKYGGSGSDTAVVKALRWLKDHQKDDGSWSGSGSDTAMAGLAVLCFMAHGETPASKEFGQTVEKGIRYLVSAQNPQGRFKEAGANYVYGHAIATYALAESYGMTKIVMLKEPMEKAAKIIIDGQQPGGAWDYDYKKEERKDLSVTSWQVQALKACKLAGAEVEGMDKAMEKATDGIKSFATGEGYQGYLSYTGTGRSTTLTAAGVLAMQLMGREKLAVMTGLEALKELPCVWAGDPQSNTYAWYYATQAKFQYGGPMWNDWNSRILPMLVKNQKEDGHWLQGGTHSSSDVYDTCLCCLCLEVYYRYLPTYARVEEVQRAPRTKDEADIKIAVDLAL